MIPTFDNPGPAQETYEMHLRTVCIGHEEGAFVFPLQTPLAKAESHMFIPT